MASPLLWGVGVLQTQWPGRQPSVSGTREMAVSDGGPRICHPLQEFPAQLTDARVLHAACDGRHLSYRRDPEFMASVSSNLQPLAADGPFRTCCQNLCLHLSEPKYGFVQSSPRLACRTAAPAGQEQHRSLLH